MCGSPKDIGGKPDVPADWSGFREERLGSIISSHLRASVEYIVVNVGGSGMDEGEQSTDDIPERRRRHSTRSVGKPRTWGRTPGD
jgi:hypothetical protein